MKIALGQINPTVGDLAGNVDLMIRFARDAERAGAQLVVFPELAVSGYPPRDLVEKATFLERSEEQLSRLAEATASLKLGVIAGYVGRSDSKTGKQATNSAALLAGGKVVFRQTKMLLPTYDVFDEARYFRPAESQKLCHWNQTEVALTICEDAWNDKQFWERRLYQRDPVEEMIAAGGRILISINASPYHMGKRALRREIFAATARRHHVPVVYVNQAGGNDSLVFDGSSFAVNAEGRVIASAASFGEDLVLVDTDSGTGDLRENFADECEAAYEALVLGTRDYIRKCGFERVLIGLSGGIDSSLTAVIAVDAVGRENVVGVGMPGPFSSKGSVDDARALAANLGIRFELAPDHACVRKVSERARPIIRRRAARRGRRKLAGASARRHAHGAIQQMGRAGSDHRQQERAGGGLLHALRRHVRRPGGDQRRSENAGLFALARGQPPPQ